MDSCARITDPGNGTILVEEAQGVSTVVVVDLVVVLADEGKQEGREEQKRAAVFSRKWPGSFGKAATL